MNPCPCGRYHNVYAETVAVGRFRTDGPTGWRAWAPAAPVRATREEAMRDVCPRWADTHRCCDDTCTEEHS